MKRILFNRKYMPTSLISMVEKSIPELDGKIREFEIKFAVMTRKAVFLKKIIFPVIYFLAIYFLITYFFAIYISYNLLSCNLLIIYFSTIYISSFVGKLDFLEDSS